MNLYSKPDKSFESETQNAINDSKVNDSKQKQLRKQMTKDDNQMMKYFVPGFFGVWAIGYIILATVEVSGPGLGDLGGILGAGLVVLLMFSLFGAALYDIIKPENDRSDST